MKKSQLAIGIPALVIILLIAAAFVIRAMQTAAVPKEETEDLVKELQTTVDDGGESEFKQLQQDASGL